MVLSLLCWVGAVVILSVKGADYLYRSVAGLITFLLFLMSIFYFASDYFTGAGIDESVIYHLRYGLTGAGFREYQGLIAVSSALVIAGLVTSFLVFYFLPRPRSSAQGRWHLVAICLFVPAIVINPTFADVTRLYLANSAPADEELSSYFAKPDMKASKQMNIVLIYMESLERTYFDDRLFPGLVPGLKKLEKQSLSFTDIRQAYGSAWTIAGFVASQCGIPLVTSSGGNSMSGLSDFLPGAVCIGDLLKSEGYDLNYMGGASLDFAGKGKFYRTHGFVDVRGKEKLSASLDVGSYMSQWGIFDDSLFLHAFDRFTDLSEGGRPFGLFLLTLDTHQPSGHPSASCKNRSYRDGKNPMLNAVHCTDFIVSEYVKKVRDSEFGENTLVVVASDHLAMKNTASDILEKGDRRNLLMVFSPKDTRPRSVDKAGSLLDVGPTLLSMMGFDVDKLGFGRDLLRQEPTIVETFPKTNKFLMSQKKQLSGLWEFPQLGDGLSVDPQRRQISLGKDEIDLPALLELDDKMTVETIKFQFYSKKKLISYVAEMDISQPMIWIDDCSAISAIQPDKFEQKGGYCIAAGRIGSKELLTRAVDGITSIARKDIAPFVSKAKTDPVEYERTVERLKKAADGTAQMSSISMDSSGRLSGTMIVNSAGFGGGQSYLKTDPTRAGITAFRRGLSLIGVTADSKPVKLAHVDSCSPSNPDPDNVRTTSSFSDLIESLGDAYGAYIVIAHDSAKCREAFDMGQLFEGLPLEKWDEIEFRQPYIGVLAGNGEVYEALGEVGKSITVHLESFVAPKGGPPSN